MSPRLQMTTFGVVIVMFGSLGQSSAVARRQDRGFDHVRSFPGGNRNPAVRADCGASDNPVARVVFLLAASTVLRGSATTARLIRSLGDHALTDVVPRRSMTMGRPAFGGKATTKRSAPRPKGAVGNVVVPGPPTTLEHPATTTANKASDAALRRPRLTGRSVLSASTS